jgi:hypothetical protein
MFTVITSCAAVCEFGKKNGTTLFKGFHAKYTSLKCKSKDILALSLDNVSEKERDMYI